MVAARLRASRSRSMARWAFWAESDSAVRERYSMEVSVGAVGKGGGGGEDIMAVEFLSTEMVVNQLQQDETITTKIFIFSSKRLL